MVSGTEQRARWQRGGEAGGEGAIERRGADRAGAEPVLTPELARVAAQPALLALRGGQHAGRGMELGKIEHILAENQPDFSGKSVGF